MARVYRTDEEAAQALAARQSILTTMERMLDGSLPYLEGSRTIARLRFDAGDDWDLDILPFVGVVSETDALPIGDERKFWPDAASKAFNSESTKQKHGRKEDWKIIVVILSSASVLARNEAYISCHLRSRRPARFLTTRARVFLIHPSEQLNSGRARGATDMGASSRSIDKSRQIGTDHQISDAMMCYQNSVN
jgi:hypothetical protein